MIVSRFLPPIRCFLRSFFLLIGFHVGINLYSQDTLKIVPLGNSITQGNINTAGANTYRRNFWNKLTSAGYNVDFVGSLDTDNNGNSFPDSTFDHDHEGHWGWRADQIVDNLSGWLNGYTPDVAIIHIGSNDAMQNNTVSSTLDEIEDIIGIFRNDNPQITIFLAQILPLEDANRNTRIDGINAGLVPLASSLDQPQSRIILVDHNSGWIIADHTYDGVHPNEAGEEKMAQKWFSAFDAFYSSLNEPPEITGQYSLSVDEDQQIILSISDFIVSDPDTDPGDMTLTVAAGNHYSVSGTTITPETNWYGTLTVPVTVSDGVSESEPFGATITVDPINDAPVVSDIPDQIIGHSGSFDFIHLNDYVDDIETPDSNMAWTIMGDLNLEIEIVDQIARITVVDENWYGTEVIVFTATDDHSSSPLSDSDEVTFTVDTQVFVPNTILPTVDIFANPVTDFLTFKTNNPERLFISFFSLNGQLILNRVLEGSFHKIDVSSFQKGVYFINIRTKDFVTTRKIVKL
jgi:lysophospholipase L1-like esterase